MNPLIELCAKAVDALNCRIPIPDGDSAYAAAYTDGYEAGIDAAHAAILNIPRSEIDKAAGEAVAWRYRHYYGQYERWGDWHHVGYEPQRENSNTFRKEPLGLLSAAQREGLIKEK